MQIFYKKKAKAIITIALIIIMTTSILQLAMPVKAQTNLPAGTPATNLQEGGSIHPLPSGVTPNASFDSYAQLSFRPNPVGVGQSIIINLWVTPAVHVSRYFKDYKVTITDPDGKERNRNGFLSRRRNSMVRIRSRKSWQLDIKV